MAPELTLDSHVLAELSAAGARHGLARIRLARAKSAQAKSGAADELAAATAALDQARAAAADPANQVPVEVPAFLARPRKGGQR